MYLEAHTRILLFNLKIETSLFFNVNFYSEIRFNKLINTLIFIGHYMYILDPSGLFSIPHK